MDGVGVIRGELTGECAALFRAVLNALSAPKGPGTCVPLACRMMPAASGCAVRLSPERECTDCARHGDVLH